MKVILIVLCLLALSTSHRINRTQRRGRPTGLYTDLIVAQDNIGKDPSQYFLCGVQLREREWTFQPPQRKVEWYKPWRRFFKPGRSTYRNMTSGITLIFCNQRDWKNQINKTFATGSENNTKWREILMCPAGLYATGVTPKFSVIRGKDQGLTGLQMTCSTPLFDLTHTVDDNQVQRKFEILKGEEGTFISGVRVRQQRGNKLSGILVAFEPMTMITSYDFSFNLPAEFTFDPIQIDFVSSKNQGSETVQETLKAQKEVTFKNSWKLNEGLNHISDYLIQASTTSNFFPTVIKTDPTQHLKEPQNFGFNKQLESTLFAQKQILAVIPSCSTLTVNTVLPQKSAVLPFKLTVTFSSQFSHKQIGTSTYDGVWSGTVTGQVQFNPTAVVMLGCGVAKPENLRTDSP